MPSLGNRRFLPRVSHLEERIAPATLPTGFVETGINTVANPFSSATAMEFAPDGKLFVLEQAGTIEVYSGSGTSWTRLQTNFLTNVPLSVDSFFERGMLGITFDPSYASNRFVYLYYTTTVAPVHNRVIRVTANATGDLALAGTLTPIVELDNLSAGNHNGGAIHFGPDGKLYVAVGENAVPANAQSITTRLGKMLRYNSDGTIPAGNPTSIPGIAGTTTGANQAIWAAGLRNPYTFTFHPTTGQMYINDVGQNAWEEINIGAAGANYGWSSTEGRFTQASFPNFTNPIVAYAHSGGTTNYPPGGPTYTGFAITGGAFYVSAAYPFPSDYVGDYFFADYVSGFIKRFDPTTNTVINFATSALGCVELKVGTDGCLYYLARDAISSASGRVFRVNFTGSSAPYIVTPPTNQTVAEGHPATFTVQAGGPGISYQWIRNGGDILGATSASYTIPSPMLADNGAVFSVRVTNTTNNVTSTTATLTVNMNQPPIPTILTPIAGTFFSYGNAFSYSGSATDPEDGTLAGAAFTWWVTYHTGGLERPFIPETPGNTTGMFSIPNISPYTLPDVFYRVHLRVQDINGSTTEVTRDLQPNVAQVTLATNPAGGTVLLDGMSFTTPYVFTGVAGQQRALSVPVPATIGGLAYSWVSWSDTGALTHDILTPLANTTYTATFVNRPPLVATVRVDDGSSQRSMVRSLQVTFDAIVNYAGLPGNAYAISGPGGPYNLVVGTTDNSSGRSIVSMTFNGPGVVNSSLPDGDFTFMILGTQLADSLAQNLDGDANGSAGGDYSTTFHRLFGDADGDRSVAASDFILFRLAFGGNGPSAFDYDNDGTVSAMDFINFRLAFGNSI